MTKDQLIIDIDRSRLFNKPHEIEEIDFFLHIPRFAFLSCLISQYSRCTCLNGWHDDHIIDVYMRRT